MNVPTLSKTPTITLVTGGNNGLGYETARRLLGAGHTVLLSARDAGRGQQAADELGVNFIPLDVTEDGSVAAAVDQVRARYGRLDVLINNAGVVGPRRRGVDNFGYQRAWRGAAHPRVPAASADC